jgi:hypothetical protein
MSRRLRREGESATALAALDNAYLQGIVQIIDAAMAREAPEQEIGAILAHLLERGLFTYKELADMGRTDISNITRWSIGQHIPQANNSAETVIRLLDNARGQLARRVAEGLGRA